MRVALVQEFLNQYGGSERVLEVFHELFPDATVYTLIYEPSEMPAFYKEWKIIDSPFLKYSFIRRYYKSFFFIYPIAIEQFDLSNYDLVISNSYSYTHGVFTPVSACHICYCYTPMRFVWVYPQEYRKKIHPALKPFYTLLIHYLAIWDRQASARPDYYLAVSEYVANRIKKYYNRTATVIYPPVNTELFTPADSFDRDDYYLLVSRLVLPHKRPDVVIEAFNKLKLPLIIVGDGTDRKILERRANPNIQFLGKIPDSTLVGLYQRCKAVIFPSEDEFGLVPLEANACGRPVIAFRGGGAIETMKENVTCVFFNEQSPEAIIDAVHRFEKIEKEFNPETLRAHALSFSKKVFKEKIKNFIDIHFRQHS